MTGDPTNQLSMNRRAVLKASGATAVGLAAFSGTGSATEPDEISFCACSEVCVDFTGEENRSYRIVYATGDEGDYSCDVRPAIDEIEHTRPGCFDAGEGEMIIGVLDGTRSLYQNPNDCAQGAIEALGDLNDCAGCTEDDGTPGDCISNVYTVDDYDGGPDEYDAPEGVTIYADDDCCVPCESGEELLVKYEWEGGKFSAEGNDGNIELASWELDEDGEPLEACFMTHYCEVDAVVKAGQGYETYVDESGAFCVTGITTENPQGKEVTHAISNVQFFCVAPDDPSVGNSSGRSGNSPGKSGNSPGRSGK